MNTGAIKNSPQSELEVLLNLQPLDQIIRATAAKKGTQTEGSQALEACQTWACQWKNWRDQPNEVLFQYMDYMVAKQLSGRI